MKNKSNNWFYTHLRQVHLDMHWPEGVIDNLFSNFDARQLVNKLSKAHINYIGLCAKDHFGHCYYDTAIGHRHKDLRDDFVKPLTDECNRQRIKTAAYYSLVLDGKAWEKHPNWRFVDEKGKNVTEGIFKAVCLNSPYTEELALPQLEELATSYPIDSFFIDIPFLTPSVCYCDYCKAVYQKETGHELTSELPDAEKMRSQQLSAIRFFRKLRIMVDRRNPQLLIASNQACKPIHSRDFSDLSDCGVWESHPDSSSFLTHSVATRTCRVLNQPVQVMTSRFMDNWGDSTAKPVDQMLTEAALLLGNGGIVSMGDHLNPDGSLNDCVYDSFEKVFRFVKERENFFIPAVSVPHCAILIPRKRRDTSFNSGLLMPPMYGAAKVFNENHIQYDIVNSLDIEKIKDYKIVVMPEPGNYSQEALVCIKQFVADGGTVIAEGGALLDDGQFQMEDLFGVKYCGMPDASLVYFKPHAEVKGRCVDDFLQFKSQAYQVKPAGCEPLAEMYCSIAEDGEDSEFRFESFPGATPWQYPFATVHSYGRGKAIYIGGDLFRLYWNTNNYWLRDFVGGIVKHLAPPPPFVIEAGPTVEANLMASGNNLFLNLMQYQIGVVGDPNAFSVIDQVFALKEITCCVQADRVAQVSLEPGGRAIEFCQSGGYVKFVVPELLYMATVKIELAT